MNKLEAKLEAFLFLHGEPIRVDKLAKELGVKNEEIRKMLDLLSHRLREAEDRGLELIFSDDKVQLTTKADLKPFTSKIVAEEMDTPLTPASLETLSIVAYLGPCSRALIEYIRGVNSTFILRSLMIRGLVERAPDPDRANAFLYRTSFDFLRHIGVSRPEELPDYDKYRKLKDESFSA